MFHPAPHKNLAMVFWPVVRSLNVHDVTVNGDARTNNMCEGWNNKFFNLVGHAHPSIWHVIEWCQKEEATEIYQMITI
jgi:hypothetical protein